MRKRNFKKLAALFIIAVYALSTFVFVGAADDLGGFEGGHATISRSDEFANGGSYSMKVVLPDEVPDYENYGRIDLLKYLESGNEYEISFYVYQDQVETAKGLTTTLNYQQADGDEQWLNDGTHSNWIKEKEWTEIKRSVDLTEGGELTKAALYFETIEVDFYIDDFVVYDVTNKVEVLKIDFEVEEEEEPVVGDFFYDFEDGVQGWTGVDAVDGEIGVTAIETTTEEVADGESSLKVTFKPGHEKYQVRLPKDVLLPGQTITLKVFIPEGTNLNGFQPFSQGGEGWSWDDKWYNAEEGKWIDVEYTIPEGIEDPIQRVGIQFLYPDNEVLDEEAVVYIDSADLDPRPEVEEPVDDDEEDEKPAKTGYASTLGYLLLAAASAGVIAKKKRK